MSERFTGFVEVTPAAVAEIVTLLLDGETGAVSAGGNGAAGALTVRGTTGAEAVSIAGDSATLVAGGSGSDGSLVGRDAAGQDTVTLLARLALLALGSPGIAGNITLHGTGEGPPTVRVDGGAARIDLGGNGIEGKVYVQNAAGNNTIHVLGEDARLTLGGSGADGDIYLRTAAGAHTIHLDGATARVDLGGNGIEGKVYVQNAAGNNTIHVLGEDARLTLGGSGADGDIYLRTAAGADTIHLDGASGDISFLNADCAEDFAVEDSAAVDPGTVMVLGEHGLLKPGSCEYDKAVVGVVSGAGGLRPGIVLDRQGAGADRFPIALMGKVYCKADADYRPIEIGDLLTTSPTLGHAMRADASANAFGSVLGKALAPLGKGRGLIPMLIGLQ